MHGGSWLAVFLVMVVLVLANAVSWSLGVGTYLTLPGRPKGTELELFFGWPAHFRAELWRSNDPALASRILASAPFYRPDDEMERHVRYTGISAVAVDVLFALLLAGSVGIAVESLWLGGWQPWFRWAGPLLLIGSGLLFFLSERVSVHL